MTDLCDEIVSLKKQANATILAHYYQDGDIQDMADYTGDSLKLARIATQVPISIPPSLRVSTAAGIRQILNLGQLRSATWT